MGEQREREHENEAAGVRQQSNDEGVRALRRVAAGEVTGSPAQHRRQAETDGHELFGGGQS